MAQTIEVAKAVHLLGVKRSLLQKLIKSGDLHTFEGKIDVEELKTCFPSVAFVANTFEAELEYIKKAAYSNRVQDAIMPDQIDLGNQLHRTRVKLVVEQQKAKKYMSITEDLLAELANLRSDSSDSNREVIDEISQWVLQRMNKKP